MIYDSLELASPWLNAAGTLGYTPPAQWLETQGLGGFITNPVSLQRRTPAAARGVWDYPGGFLLHTGLPTPGLQSVLSQYARHWAQARGSIWVHLLANTPNEAQELSRTLEGVEGVTALELGLPPGIGSQAALDLVSAASGELPLVVQIEVTRAGEPWLRRLRQAGASALSLGAPRGALPDPEAPHKLVTGRLYGPSLLPLALAGVRALLPHGLPVIAGTGVFSQSAGEALLKAGAWAVQIDVALWAHGFPLP